MGAMYNLAVSGNITPPCSVDTHTRTHAYTHQTETTTCFVTTVDKMLQHTHTTGYKELA